MATSYLRIYENEVVPAFSFEELSNQAFYENLVDVEKQLFKEKFEVAKQIATEYNQREENIVLFVHPEIGKLGLYFKGRQARVTPRGRSIVPQFIL